MRKLHLAHARLTEGENYAFTLMKTIALDEDGPDEWYVLRDPMGFKVLMPARYYTSYGFVAGQTIICRVDRINCNGRMFLEPAHPQYVEGAVYHFDVVDTEKRTEEINHESFFLHVKDVLGNVWPIRISNRAWMENPPPYVDCRIDRIKKGKLYLIPVSDPKVLPPLTPGDTVTLTVAGTAPDPDDGQPCFVLKLADDYTFLLKKKHYARYGFTTGMQVACAVHKPVRGRMPHIEPKHPVYEIGQIYSFDVAWLEQQVYADGYVQQVLVLYDCFGEEVKVHVSGDEATRYRSAKKVHGRVKGILKSRPELELV